MLIWEQDKEGRMIKMDKSLEVIEYEKEAYIDWLMAARDMTKAEVELMASVMGY